jgi:ABC-2 type transport system ATP-binding protein
VADSPTAREQRTDVPAMTPAPAIEAHGVEKRYGDKHVLRGVDLEVRCGELLCLLGPNGAGKTTTVEILEGFRTATRGSVSVLGFDPATQPQALRERVGVVLQECGFPKHLRVGELVNAWRGYYPNPRPLGDLLDVVELQKEKGTLVRRLSGGQRRRLDFALALAGDPELIFLDEPTTGFDPEARLRCWSAMENLRALGKTILLTTHYLDEAERLADRVAILSAGRIQMVGSPRTLARNVGAPSRLSFTLPEPVRRGGVRTPDGLGITVTGDRAVVAAFDPSAVLRTLIAWADNQGLGGLEDLEVIPPDLEDVYLNFFGSQNGDGR